MRTLMMLKNGGYGLVTNITRAYLYIESSSLTNLVPGEWIDATTN